MYDRIYYVGIAHRGNALPTLGRKRERVSAFLLNQRRMIKLSSFARFNRVSLVWLADWLAVAVAIALPWSTSAVGICVAVWLIALVPTLDVAVVRRELATAAGGFAVLLWCLAALGMLWADVPWHERFAGFNSFHRLLAIPLLLAQFRRSNNGTWVVCGFFISSVTVLIASYIFVLVFWRTEQSVYGVPVHDTIFQGSLFLICGFGALGYAALTRGRHFWIWPSTVFAIGVLFLGNFAFATASRIALATAPLLFLLLGWRLLRWKGVLAALLLAAMLGAGSWFASSGLRERVAGSIAELQAYRLTDKPTSIGAHLAFLNESLTIIASAPIIGHGIGSIAEQFSRVTAGKTGASGESTVNPHNQTFAIAIQLGLIGALVLWAMWIAHLTLFRGCGVVAWFGLLIVVENIVSSTVHSHLFDFNNGWLYVFGTGVLGGTILRQRDVKKFHMAPPRERQ